MVRHVMLMAAKLALPLTSITDKAMGNIVDHAAFALGFSLSDKFQKINIYGAYPANEIANIVEGLSVFFDTTDPGYQDFVYSLREPDGWTEPQFVAAEEHVLWPGKLADGAINNYIVPIQPRWAEQLFDEGGPKGV